MLTKKEQKQLQALLALAEDPDQAFTYHELLGYLFGLAITPELILPSEWMAKIFGASGPIYDSIEQLEEFNSNLFAIYNQLIARFSRNELDFPFNINRMKKNQFLPVYEWVSGFDEALALRPDLWEPEEFPNLNPRNNEELFFSMLVIQGLVDPLEVTEFFDTLPDEAFMEVFPGYRPGLHDRQAQVQAFLLDSLPLAVSTLQAHAHTLEQVRKEEHLRSNAPVPLRKNKIGRNSPCPCGSGKKYKKCCERKTSPATERAPSRPAGSKKSKVIQGNFPQHGKKRRRQRSSIYQLKVAIHKAKPPIWRRIQVPGSITLYELHEIIQFCMGWTDSHLHQFEIGNKWYGEVLEEDEWAFFETRDETQYTLDDLQAELSPYFHYTYDFGDDWRHRITVEKTLKADEGEDYPVLLTGRKACPPEDCGGIYGYLELLDILNDPEHEEYQEAIAWLGDDFDPNYFSKDEISRINALLKKLYRNQ